MEEKIYIAEISKCVRCGSCKAYCPTYDEGLTEAMGARGRLALLRGLLTGRLALTPVLRERIFGCLLCGACEKSCPPEVRITEAIYHARKLIRPRDRKINHLRRLMLFSARRPMVSFRFARTLQQVGVSPGKILDVLGSTYRRAQGEGIRSSERKGTLPFTLTIPGRPLRDDRQVYKPQKKIGRVALFAGCSVNFVFPNLGLSLINVLMRLGYEVVLPRGEVCCGAPFRSLGLEEDAVELAKRNIDIFGKLNAEAVLSLCPTCTLSISKHYRVLTGRGIDNAMDVSSFLLPILRSRLDHVHGLNRVTYHDPCHLNYSLGVREQPRELILRSGAELVEAEGEGCCGFGGLFSLHHRELSGNLLRKRLNAYVATGAEALITACPGCIIQLGSGMRDKPVFHVVELVEQALCSKETADH
jgi:glycolate oxidase iron-sulfur subunit